MAQKKQYPELPRKPLGPGWWLANRHYTLYMIREVTSFFVAIFSILYIYQVALLAGSPGSYDQYLTILRNPIMVAFSVIILGFTLYHSLTWFYLTGKVQPLKVGGKKTTPVQSLIVNTILMVIISIIIISLFLVGK